MTKKELVELLLSEAYGFFPYMRVKTLAGKLGVSTGPIYRLIHLGQLHPVGGTLSIEDVAECFLRNPQLLGK